MIEIENCKTYFEPEVHFVVAAEIVVVAAVAVVAAFQHPFFVEGTVGLTEQLELGVLVVALVAVAEQQRLLVAFGNFQSLLTG
jgi:hypothetical protein